MEIKNIDKNRLIIESKIAELEDLKLQYIKYEEIGSASEDNATEYEEFEEKAAILKNINQELEEYEEALDAIKQGTYGKCVKCSAAIEGSRLEAFPSSTYCSTHAKK